MDGTTGNIQENGAGYVNINNTERQDNYLRIRLRCTCKHLAKLENAHKKQTETTF